MSTITVVRARFPLGTFLGHRGVGVVSDFPDTARLHSALVHAAGKGSSAVERAGDLRPSAQSIKALQWLEEHPPVGITHPRLVPVSTRRVLSWRHEGTNEKRDGQPQARKVLKSQSDAVAVAGTFEWGWEAVPDDVAAVLDDLCADVSCLGEADAPVVLSLVREKAWVGEWALDSRQSGFPAPGGRRSRSPIAGRVHELERQYDELHPAKRPSSAQDRHSWAAVPASPVPVANFVRDYVYRSRTPASPLPWPQVILFDVIGQIDESWSVPWSVAFHRALVSRLPEPAPGLITGRYPASAPTPPNRVAIHLLPATTATADPLERPAFALLVPAGAAAEDLLALESGLRGLHRIYSTRGEVRLGERRFVDTVAFWSAPAAGNLRFWRPLPALVPEVRRQRGGATEPWTLADAAALSAAHVFRDRIEIDQSAVNRRVAAVSAARKADFAIHEIHVIRDSRIGRYAHKTPEGMTVQPYTGLVDLGSLAPDRALLALGQSRHLGGGLLFPEDVPLPIARARGLRR